jgi:hypothetical protein
MTADEFEQLDEFQVELWIAGRFQQLAGGGYPPSQALHLAVRPDVDVEMAVALIRECEAAVRSG